MVQQNDKSFVEAAQATFELKLVERLRKAEEDLANRVRVVESKLQTAKQIAWVIAAIAGIFGVSSGWGWTLLLEAKAELDATSKRVTEVGKSVQNLEPLTQAQVTRLQSEGTVQVQRFRDSVKREADLAFKAFQSQVSSPSTELRTRSVQIVNAEGKTLVSLGGSTGEVGLVQVFDANTGRRVGVVGAVDGNGGIWIWNKSGQLSLSGLASATGGNFSAYNAESGQNVASTGASSDGSGVWVLSSKAGKKLLVGTASAGGGSVNLFSADSGKVVANIGANDGTGFFGLWDRSGNFIQR